MASQKITAMTAATTVNLTDVFPIVQSGTNKKATRDVFLSIAAGEYFLTQSAASYLYLDDASLFELSVASGMVINFLWAGFQVFNVDTSGNINVQAYTGSQYVVSSNGGSITIDAAGGVTIVDASGGSVSITYHAGNVTDWSSLDPLYVAKALDRLAAWVAANLGAIP